MTLVDLALADKIATSRDPSKASIKHRAIQTSILDRLQEVGGLDFFAAREVGDGAGDL